MRSPAPCEQRAPFQRRQPQKRIIQDPWPPSFTWGRSFPGFTEHEQRLHTQAALRDAVSRTGGLTMVTAQTFQHPRTSTAGRLQTQAEGRHYSTFSLYTPEELRTSITPSWPASPAPKSAGLTSTS